MYMTCICRMCYYFLQTLMFNIGKICKIMFSFAYFMRYVLLRVKLIFLGLFCTTSENIFLKATN